MNDYDRRQLNLMLEKINTYNSGKYKLSWLIDNLYGLCQLLEEKNKEWETEFIGWWWGLEQVYAVYLDENRPLDKDGYKIIAEALEGLICLIQERLNQNHFQSESTIYLG